MDKTLEIVKNLLRAKQTKLIIEEMTTQENIPKLKIEIALLESIVEMERKCIENQ
jgi:hypothetical protein